MSAISIHLTIARSKQRFTDRNIVISVCPIIARTATRQIVSPFNCYFTPFSARYNKPGRIELSSHGRPGRQTAVPSAPRRSRRSLDESTKNPFDSIVLAQLYDYLCSNRHSGCYAAAINVPGTMKERRGFLQTA